MELKISQNEINHIESRARAVAENLDWGDDDDADPESPNYAEFMFFSCARSHVLRLCAHANNQAGEIEQLKARIAELEITLIKRAAEAPCP